MGAWYTVEADVDNLSLESGDSTVLAPLPPGTYTGYDYGDYFGSDYDSSYDSLASFIVNGAGHTRLFIRGTPEIGQAQPPQQLVSSLKDVLDYLEVDAVVPTGAAIDCSYQQPAMDPPCTTQRAVYVPDPQDDGTPVILDVVPTLNGKRMNFGQSQVACQSGATSSGPVQIHLNTAESTVAGCSLTAPSGQPTQFIGSVGVQGVSSVKLSLDSADESNGGRAVTATLTSPEGTVLFAPLVWSIESPNTVQVPPLDAGGPAGAYCRGAVVCGFQVTGSGTARVRVSIDGTSISQTVDL